MQGPEANPVDPVEHPLDLVVAALVEGDAGQARAEDFELSRAGDEILGRKVKTGRKLLDGRLGNRAIGLDQVDFGNFAVGIHEAIGPAAVVSQEDEPGRAAIEATGEMQGGFVRVIDQVEHGGVLGVDRRADDSRRLVEHNVEALNRCLESFGADFDGAEAIDLGQQLLGHDPVDADFPGNDLAPGAALAEAKFFRDEVIEPHEAARLPPKYRVRISGMPATIRAMRNPFAFALAGSLLFALAATTFAEEDRLVLVGASYGKNVLAICEADGTVIWKHDTAGPEKGHAGHHDVHLLENGNILFHDSWTKTQEITLGKEVVWEYDSKTMNGNEGKRVDVHAFNRLPNGDTMIVESGVGRIIHVDREGKITKEFPLGEGGRKSTRLVRMLENGNYLACAENPGVVTEYDGEGKVVWEYPINTRVYGAIRLKNGNTLICSGSGNSVVEVNPAKEIVWEVAKQVPGTEITLGWMTCLEELPNGNFALGNCHAGDKNPQILEITRDKKVVWQFDEWDLVGNGLACWQILDAGQTALVREKLAALQE